MIIREASDLHTEFLSLSEFEEVTDNILVPHIKGEDGMVLILAGDIVANFYSWYGQKHFDVYTPWMKELCQRHRAVIYIGGNHEGYDGKLSTVNYYWHMIASMIDNFHFLENEQVIIDDVRFLGTTLWTDITNPLDEIAVNNSMNDTSVIDGFSSEQWKFLHETANIFLEDNLLHEVSWWDGKTVVVTHHGPTFQSCSPQFVGSKINCGYYSDLDDLIVDADIDIWFHGHTHDSHDYYINDTRIVCNPYGYHPKAINKKYNPTLQISL